MSRLEELLKSSQENNIKEEPDESTPMKMSLLEELSLGFQGTRLGGEK